MAELNFGLLTPPGSQSIGNAFVTGMDQAQEARARDLQMQQSTRKGQMDELTYKKALDTESRLNKYYAIIAANGGPKTALEAENAMIGSGIPHIADMGAKAQLLRLTNESDLALFNAANPKPGAPAAAATAVAPMAPAVVPEPGSFGADVAERKAADPFATAPDTRTNRLDGAAPAAAPANNLLAAVSGAARPTISEEVAAIEDQIDRNIRLGTPRATAQVASLQTKLAALIKTTATGGSLFDSRGEVIATAPAAKSEFETLLANSGLSESEKTAARQARVGKDSTTSYEYLTVLDRLGKTTDPDARKQLLARLTYLSTHRPPSTQTVNLPGQEKAFDQELGKGQAKGILESRSRADDAVEIMTTVAEGRKILASGAITGFGADFIVQFSQALKQAGYDYGGDASANSQAYGANMAQNVGKIIKQFGAGTGLSDADREYAEKMAGGKITMDLTAIRRVLDINEKQARWVIATHNKRVAGIKSNIPLTVEAPTAGSVEIWVRGADGVLRRP